MDREFIWVSLVGGLIPVSLIYHGGWEALKHPILLIMFIAFVITILGLFAYIFNSDSDNNIDSTTDSGEKNHQAKITNLPIKRTQDECEILLNRKGYDLWNNSPSFLVMKKDSMAVLFNSESLNDIYNWADKAKDASSGYTPKKTQRTSAKTEEDKYIESIAPGNFDDSY
jgi:c-di-AMP phosphodiesterase-like protein